MGNEPKNEAKNGSDADTSKPSRGGLETRPSYAPGRQQPVADFSGVGPLDPEEEQVLAVTMCAMNIEHVDFAANTLVTVPRSVLSKFAPNLIAFSALKVSQPKRCASLQKDGVPIDLVEIFNHSLGRVQEQQRLADREMDRRRSARW